MNDAPVTLPVTRSAGCPFDPPAGLAELREQAPVTPLAFPDGHRGWLVTGHAEVRAVLADRRFSSRYEFLHHPTAAMGPLPAAPPGDLTGLDAPEHTRYRRLLTGRFTVRRMNLLTERVRQITADHLDAMERLGPPADLVRVFAQPIPALMICELLGVPYADRDNFQHHAAALTGVDTDEQEQFAAYGELQRYIDGLVQAKRDQPADDLLGDLTATDLTDGELAGVGTFLLAAGLDTTANMLALGTYALLSDPAQLDVLRAEPERAPRAVEELLRHLTIAHTVVRAALEDVELAGRLIRAGESIVVSLSAANRDPRRYADPDRLDLRRDATGHLSFGHGIHQCLGQQLARVELRTALPALVTRFPGLRLAVAPEEVPVRAGTDVHGVLSLPVRW
ncbi:cytochrome P450 [Nonomuraea sp. NPDC049684]|uniref:cytochrome P450 n=1 Tax=Nonomuraea sp. NPDC049684 TaxID=3364356 RepID=UPI0037AC73C4